MRYIVALLGSLFLLVKNITPNKEIQKYSDFGGFQFSELRGKKSPDFYTW